MSIRLRLTLLYSAILALTLIGFSTALYVTQSEATLSGVKANLVRQAEGFTNSSRHFPGGRPNQPFPQGNYLPGRWTQTRDASGGVLARTGDLGDVTLPLSDAGLRAVQKGTGWFETAQVEDEPLLIYSRSFISPAGESAIVQVAAPITEREQSLNTLRLILSVGSGLVILGAFAVGWVLSGAALSPIHQITRTAQAIGAEHNFTRRVEHSGPTDEIGQLAITFNGMLTELESAYRQLQDALESQRRFVADASHELRTPLTTVRGNIELLAHEPPLEKKERAEVLADTKDEVERLIRLVNQLLVLARSDAGRALRQEPIEIQPLVEDVCRQSKLRAPERDIQCEAHPGAIALADRDALKQVLVILLDNALVHTPPSASVRLTTEHADKQVMIRVRDTGPGISAHALPHIFERFYRGNTSRSGPGTGLGLSIAKELVEAQGGTIGVESAAGQGTVFTVTLTRATA